MTPAVLDAAPGQAVTYELRVRNTGTVVDEFTFEPLGDAAPWVEVDRPVLPLFPGAEEAVQVSVTPPRAAQTPSGTMPFAVRVASREDPEGSAVAEATVEVGTFVDLFAELVPRTARGRRQGSTDLAVDNRGNLPIALALSGVDEDGLLDIRVEPPAVTTDPGTATFADVVVRPKKAFWRGPSKTLPFQVVAGREDVDEALVVDGTLVQEPLVPKWALRGLMAFLLLALLFIPLWLAFLKPEIQSAAREAAAEEVAEVMAENAGAGGGGGSEAEGAGGGGGSDGEGGGGDGGATATPPTPDTVPPPAPAPVPQALRLAVSAAPGGGTDVDTFPVLPGQVFRLTDVVLQNPEGDTGRLEVQRDGAPLLSLALQNFRDIDYHFVAPIVFTEGQTLQLHVRCDAVAPRSGSPERCTPSGSFVGFLGPP